MFEVLLEVILYIPYRYKLPDVMVPAVIFRIYYETGVYNYYICIYLRQSYPIWKKEFHFSVFNYDYYIIIN